MNEFRNEIDNWCSTEEMLEECIFWLCFTIFGFGPSILLSYYIG